MDDWIDYYDSTHTIYVSKLHRDVHFRLIARDIIGYVPSPSAVVLDYSCGEAISAGDVADSCDQLILAEPAPGVRGRLTARFADNPKIVVRSLDDLKQLKAETVDLAVMISVAQYMTPAELDGAVALMRRVLKPGGRLVLGDILRPEVGAATDVIALLKLAARNGFLIDALWGLARTALSDYWQLRQNIGLQRYSENDITTKLQSAGFSVTPAGHNVGHNPSRMTFLATPRA
jgi:ubiquinone/menaquinone biosynthesis C-methylase UbiE